MSTSNCKDGIAKLKSNDDGVCDLNNMLQNMSTGDEDVSECANCGKEGDDVNNVCNKCKMVKYCNAVCKKVHKKKHKKDCEEHVKLAAERAAELHDKKLFRQPPPAEDCPICFLRIPSLASGSVYYSCCGKEICSGCSHAPRYDHQGNIVDNEKCPFCIIPTPYTNEEIVERTMKRMKANDTQAIYSLGGYYADGAHGLPQDYAKALELWHQAAELGNASAYRSIGFAYNNGRGVGVDKKKAKHYYELAAMQGETQARHNLGLAEELAGNMDRAVKHHMIAVKGGCADSLKQIQNLYKYGFAGKEDYTKALQLYQAYLGEIKSPQRDKAAAADEENRYY